ncbi:hypothetical protein LTS18_003088 [Coniosporium uncinatum]|uniref:Uncharacterized protein n=1 Tax=Coniosporium uncinatum TaxID=93489 RepID=A0ACC3DBN4_9PEZI|nr:hypothetical protein LTS18_003088 [Coniosporium uncinatum]
MSTGPVRCWAIKSQDGIQHGLLLLPDATLPKLSAEHVLVELHAASLNYRDVAILKRALALEFTPCVTAGSDGAGVVLETGSSVSDFHKGDKVVMHLAPDADEDELPTYEHIFGGLGQKIPGTLTERGVFPKSALMKMPSNLTFEQAATLTCSALTAWNALLGLRGRELRASDWVLVQGTGGVSVAALQFALAAGATVVATTSSDVKAGQLKALGAHHIINYRNDPDWGVTARSLTPKSRGVDHVIDVGGDNTLAQSLKAVRLDGLISAVGLVGGPPGAERPALMDVLWNLVIVRGVLLGSRVQFAEMNAFVEKHRIDIALDDEVFGFDQVKEAYEKVDAQKHFSKVVIKMR